MAVASAMVKIITDTTASLPAELARIHGIAVIPQIITFGHESFREEVDIDYAGFLARLLSTSELPKTAAPPPELFAQEFRRLAPAGETIFCIHPSSEVSGTVRSAAMAAAEFPGADIRVIDTRVVGSPLAILAVLAAEWSEAGLDADSIEARLRRMIQQCRVYFLVATLDYLARGGRIGGAAAAIGNLLEVKPILVLREGRVEQLERSRSLRRALERLEDLVAAECPRGGNGHLSIMHAAVPEQGDHLAQRLKQRLGLSHVWTSTAPPAVVAHAGPGLLGVGFFAQNDSVEG